MKLLEKKLFNLPSEHVPAVIGEVLKAEYMLVWAYHDSDDVREFAIRVIVTRYTPLLLRRGLFRAPAETNKEVERVNNEERPFLHFRFSSHFRLFAPVFIYLFIFFFGGGGGWGASAE